jgi:hypothetical protein
MSVGAKRVESLTVNDLAERRTVPARVEAAIHGMPVVNYDLCCRRC